MVVSPRSEVQLNSVDKCWALSQTTQTTYLGLKYAHSGLPSYRITQEDVQLN
uniref:Uncharacterized protein n=1 Tax=Anguilla anguilla TaxID=7936 RepID=A0A0E9QNX5_ANGAN